MRHLLLLALALVPTCSCTGALTPQQQRAATVLDCRVDALVPYVDNVIDAEELALETIKGKADPAEIMARLGLELVDIVAASQAWQACDQFVAKAPPPGRGHKVL